MGMVLSGGISMSLPIYQSDSKELSMMQTNWARQLDPVIAFPVTSGLILASVTLAVGSNTVNHRLGRKLQGWCLVRQRGAAAVYDTQDSNQHTDLTLLLTSSAGVVVDILVF